MRTVLFLAAIFALLTPGVFAQNTPSPGEKGPPAFADLKLVLLRQAAADGRVKVGGINPSGYRRVTLKIENRGDQRLAVDLCGSFLRPKKKGSCQRLGLGPAITPQATLKLSAGTIVVHLEPGEKKSIRMNTVCLDAGRSCPGSQSFVISPDALPAVREKVMRWWADHPDVPQGAVNSAIWRFSETVRITPGTAVNYTTPKGSFAALHGGTYYRLTDGALSCLDTDGIERILGAEMFSVLPCAGAVYGVALSDTGTPELWRLALTGEQPWGRVMPVGNGLRVLEVIPAGSGRIGVVTDGGLFIRDLAAGETKSYFANTQILDLSARAVSDTRVLVALRVPGQGGYYQGGERKGSTSDIFELWTLDPRRGEPELMKRFWNVSAMSIGPAGVFGLSHLGVLRKIKGKSFKDFGSGAIYKQILAVGKSHVWLQSEKDDLVVVNTKTGTAKKLEVIVDDSFAGDIDTVSDDLAFTNDGKFYRVSAKTGEVIEQ